MSLSCHAVCPCLRWFCGPVVLGEQVPEQIWEHRRAQRCCLSVLCPCSSAGSLRPRRAGWAGGDGSWVPFLWSRYIEASKGNHSSKRLGPVSCMTGAKCTGSTHLQSGCTVPCPFRKHGSHSLSFMAVVILEKPRSVAGLNYFSH